MQAARFANFPVVEYLVQHGGADLNATASVSDWFTLLTNHSLLCKCVRTAVDEAIVSLDRMASQH